MTRRTNGHFLSGGRKARVEGFTLLEIMIAAAVMIVLMAAIYSLVTTSTKTQQTGSAVGTIEAGEVTALDQMADDLRNATRTSIVLTLVSGIQAVSFSRVTGMDAAGNPILSAQITWTCQYDTGELNNGADDNRDGLIDEWNLVRTQGAITRVICRRVREGGYTLVQNAGGAVDITLTLENKDANNRLVSRMLRTTVAARN